MAEIKWIKITTDIFDDDKILLIESLPDADAIIVIWFKLLCLAGKQNNSGVFLLNDRIPYTDKMLATIFRRKESTVQLALQTFEQFGMIEVVDGVITIPNWGKHQNLDALEKKTAYMREYMKEYRQKQKMLAAASESEANCKTNSNSNVSRLDKNREDKTRKEEEKAPARSTRESEESELEVNPNLGKVLSYYMDKFNPTPSSQIVLSLQDYLQSLDADVIIHAMQIALDERKFAWSYLNAILKRYKANGLSTMEKVLISEQEYQSGKKNRSDDGRRRVKAPEEYKGEDFISFLMEGKDNAEQ